MVPKKILKMCRTKVACCKIYNPCTWRELYTEVQRIASISDMGTQKIAKTPKTARQCAPVKRPAIDILSILVYNIHIGLFLSPLVPLYLLPKRLSAEQIASHTLCSADNGEIFLQRRGLPLTLIHPKVISRLVSKALKLLENQAKPKRSSLWRQG